MDNNKPTRRERVMKFIKDLLTIAKLIHVMNPVMNQVIRKVLPIMILIYRFMKTGIFWLTIINISCYTL